MRNLITCRPLFTKHEDVHIIEDDILLGIIYGETENAYRLLVGNPAWMV
jgi:hypothetical protein